MGRIGRQEATRGAAAGTRLRPSTMVICSSAAI